jgi:hypothetical protein
VKEKFTANVNEAPDLSLALAFESHRAPQQDEKPNRNDLEGSHCAVLAWVRPRDRGEQNESESEAHAF